MQTRLEVLRVDVDLDCSYFSRDVVVWRNAERFSQACDSRTTVGVTKRRNDVYNHRAEQVVPAPHRIVRIFRQTEVNLQGALGDFGADFFSARNFSDIK